MFGQFGHVQIVLDGFKLIWTGSNYKNWSRKINFEPFQIDLNPFNQFGPIKGQGITLHTIRKLTNEQGNVGL